MFVFRREDLPADPVFPPNLEKLGYFVTANDQIKRISDPDEDFEYKVNRNSRWNEKHREAMNECIRNIVSSRLQDLGLVTLRLPLSSGPKKPHAPILVSKNLSTASRIIVVFGEPVQDLGIWAYRTVGSESIDAGSAVAFARTLLNSMDSGNSNHPSETALILANTGQLVWRCETGRAVTLRTWDSLPRRSAVDPLLVMTKRNKIPANENWQEHVNCVFNEILAARGQLVREDAKIDVIGLAEGGLGAICYLANNWDSWRPFISAICLSNPLHLKNVHFLESSDPRSFSAFLSSRCRGYLLSHHPLGFPLREAQEHECNCYSSGEELNIECIMPKAWKDMLAWLDWAYNNPDCFEEQTRGETTVFTCA